MNLGAEKVKVKVVKPHFESRTSQRAETYFYAYTHIYYFHPSQCLT